MTADFLSSIQISSLSWADLEIFLKTAVPYAIPETSLKLIVPRLSSRLLFEAVESVFTVLNTSSRSPCPDQFFVLLHFSS